jgi:hypothetical protein
MPILLDMLAAAPPVDVLVDMTASEYAVPEVPTGALHPIWGILISVILLAAVLGVSLMSSKRALNE